MKSVVRISLVALLMAGFAAPASAAPATAPARHDDSASTFGKPFYDFCVFPTLHLVRQVKEPLVLLRSISVAIPKPTS